MKFAFGIPYCEVKAAKESVEVSYHVDSANLADPLVANRRGR